MSSPTQAISAQTEFWKNWEGREVDDRFPLRQWLGSSDHSAVFLTQRSGAGSQRTVIKLIRVESLDEEAQISRWATAAKLTHPHLIRLFERGRCLIDGTRLLYVVMEFADENLAEILPLRPLSPAEVSEMLQPTVEALAYVHGSGLAHGQIRPSNIMAVDNHLKISADGLGKRGARGGARTSSAYDAPELTGSGLSPAADIWSLGITLVAVLTQNEPQLKSGDRVSGAVPETIPQPFREIARQCLQADPRQRCTVDDILAQIRTQTLPAKAPQTQAAAAKAFKADRSQPHPRSRILVPVVIVALLFLVWMGSKLITHRPPTPAAEIHPTITPPAVETPEAKSPAPLSAKQKPAQKGVARGSVLQQVLPDVSRGAQNTIEGHVRVSVQVSVDSAGNVSQAKLVSPGPSKYFANRALAAANRWKFTPPQVDGQAAASEWVLRFQFGRTGTQVFPQETKP
jgi:serine/threonine-protein kinase